MKPKLSIAQIINMSIGFMGIQFGFALQNANASRIFETLGAKADEIPGLWVAAPLTGLLVQPIIGYFSDRTWGKFGRRRPYFLVGAILSTLALFFMPNSPTLWAAAITLWLLDASINVSMEPFRAFVGDNLPNSQRTFGYAMQSFFIGVGAMIASALPYILANWFGVENTSAAGQIPDSVKWSFYIGGIFFILAVAYTVFTSHEYSPEQLASFSENGQHDESSGLAIDTSKLQSRGISAGALGAVLLAVVSKLGLDKNLYILGGGLVVVGILFLIAKYWHQNGGQNGFINIVSDLQNMPKTMKQLAVVQFFSWFSLFAMWIYATQAVTSHIYASTDTTSKAYADGADWVGILFMIYNGVAMVFALVIPYLAKATSRKTAHMLCLIAGGLGLISFYFIKDPQVLILSMVGVGFAWASILSVPYAMLSGALPSNKMGYYMGVFNFFIVIPQIVAAAILGFILKSFFNSEPIFALVVGGVCMCIAGILCYITVDDQGIEIR
jgi:maltose/moltooligosaccharide transporter